MRKEVEDDILLLTSTSNIIIGDFNFSSDTFKKCLTQSGYKEREVGELFCSNNTLKIIGSSRKDSTIKKDDCFHYNNNEINVNSIDSFSIDDDDLANSEELIAKYEKRSSYDQQLFHEL